MAAHVSAALLASLHYSNSFLKASTYKVRVRIFSFFFFLEFADLAPNMVVVVL